MSKIKRQMTETIHINSQHIIKKQTKTTPSKSQEDKTKTYN